MMTIRGAIYNMTQTHNNILKDLGGKLHGGSMAGAQHPHHLPHPFVAKPFSIFFESRFSHQVAHGKNIVIGVERWAVHS